MIKVKALLYCTKELNKGAYLVNFFGYRFVKMEESEKANFDILNGKIVCECEVETEELTQLGCGEPMLFTTKTIDSLEVCKRSCLKTEELSDYLYNQDKDSKGYALHLSSVKERVMELSECYTRQCQYGKCSTCKYGKGIIQCSTIDMPITTAPQNMMWVWVKENGEWEKRLLISIRPEWLCKILNGQKDIEIRRKVLKGMCD